SEYSWKYVPLAASHPMMETLSGASGSSAVPRSSRCAPEACHSKVTLPPPGHGSPSGHFASRVHSPTRGSSWRSACSAVGWSIDPLVSPSGAEGDPVATHRHRVARGGGRRRRKYRERRGGGDDDAEAEEPAAEGRAHGGNLLAFGG